MDGLACLATEIWKRFLPLEISTRLSFCAQRELSTHLRVLVISDNLLTHDEGTVS